MRDKIRQFVLDNFLKGEIPKNLKDDTPLLTSGIIDSLGQLTLVLWLEKEFKVEIPVRDLLPESFNTINGMVKVVVKNSK